MIKVNRDGVSFEIPELSEKEAKKYPVLGQAEGTDEYHCLYLGSKYGRDFFKRVIGYRKADPTAEGTKIKARLRVIFYARKV